MLVLFFFDFAKMRNPLVRFQIVFPFLSANCKEQSFLVTIDNAAYSKIDGRLSGNVGQNRRAKFPASIKYKLTVHSSNASSVLFT